MIEDMMVHEQLHFKEITVNNTNAMCCQKFCGKEATHFVDLHMHASGNMEIQVALCESHKIQAEREPVLIRTRRKALGALFG